MKKTLLLFVAALIALPLLINSCDDDNPLNCTQLALDYSNSASSYISDDSSANCTTLKNAIEDYLDSSCPALTTTLRASLQAELVALPCY
ncbi:hypothetical protein ACFLS4_01160 [Bacteroidota bacterium]